MTKLRRETIFINHLGPSLNKFYTMHYQVKKKEKNLIKYACKDAFQNIKPFDKPVKLTFIPILGKGQRIYDLDNYAGNVKPIIDSLTNKSLASVVQQGKSILVDDSAKYVVEFTIKQPIKDRSLQSSGMYLIMEEVDDNFDPYSDIF